jgi:hypothetical protein
MQVQKEIYHRHFYKLHELLDGKVHIPDKVGIVLMGMLGALVPIALLMHLGGALW